MKKYVVLFIFLISLAYNSFLIDDNVHQDNPFIMDESEILNHTYSEGFYPIDDDKYKITIDKFEIIFYLTLSVIFAFPYFVLFMRRLILFTPVFYQSNYVVCSLLHKSFI